MLFKAKNITFFINLFLKHKSFTNYYRDIYKINKISKSIKLNKKWRILSSKHSLTWQTHFF